MAARRVIWPMALIGMAPTVMKPTALVLNIIVAAIATFKFYKAGCFDKSLFWRFAIGSIPCAFVGGSIAIPTQFYKPIVGLVLLYAAGRLGFANGSSQPQEGRDLPNWLSIGLGMIIGLLSGLTGVGGGIFLSPLLLLNGWATIKQSAEVSALFILVNSIQQRHIFIYTFRQMLLLIRSINLSASLFISTIQVKLLILRFIAVAIGLITIVIKPIVFIAPKSEATPFPLQDYRLAFSLCPLRSLRLCGKKTTVRHQQDSNIIYVLLAEREYDSKYSRDCGYDAIDVGTLKVARTLDTFATVWVHMAAVSQTFPNIAIKVL